MIITILMAPEVIADHADEPYLREATPEESALFRNTHPSLNWMDENGRPYFPMVVDTDHPECPPSMKAKVVSRLRIRWL